MGKRIAGTLIALILAAPTGIVLTTAAADASAPTYRSCLQLNRDFTYGVAKSRRAANRQVQEGNGRPAFSARAQRVYWANHANLDRDHDGTACEG